MTKPRKPPGRSQLRVPLTLTGRGVFVLLAAAALGALWWLPGLHGVSIFCFFLSACLLLAVLLVAAAPRVSPVSRGSRVAPVSPAAHAGRILSVESSTATAGEPYTVHASFGARRHPVAAVAAEWGINEYLSETRRRSLPVETQAGEARGRQGISAALTTELHSRGPATLRLLAVRFQDPLGLVQRWIRVDASVDVLVLPRLLTGDYRSPSLDGAGAGDARQQLVDTDKRGLPGGDVREYRAGDPVRQINWKQSARQRELLVRLPEQESQWAVDLRIDTDPAAYAAAGSQAGSQSGGIADAATTAALFEHAVSAAATDGLRRLRAGSSVRLRAGAADPQLCTNASQLMRALAFVRLDDPAAATRG